ncbi:YciI family protein [Luteithermobacter gelatinilyticus]|uniref:YciI family protein n=1 Tax=Luteithermobacter gelatinilyticus TaxID=2582913 RepID=UPI001105A33A
MYFMILAYDKPGNLEVRKTTRPAHLAYVAESGAVRLAGPQLDEQQEPRGSLLIIEAADRAAAERFVENDPYRQAGLFERVEIVPFMPAAGDWLPK